MTKKELLFSFKGRVSRKTYALASLSIVGVFIIAGIFFGIYLASSLSENEVRPHDLEVKYNQTEMKEMADNPAAIFEQAEKQHELEEQKIQADPFGYYKAVFKGMSSINIAIFGTLFVLYIWVFLALSVKRVHDLNISGWVTLYSFLLPIISFSIPQTQFAITVINWLIFIAICCIKGTAGANKFGPDPIQKS